MGGYIGATGLDEVQEQFDILKDEIDANASYINTLVGIPDPTHLPFFGVNILNPGLYGLVERAEVNIKALQTQQGTSSTAISGIETTITGIEASITGIGGQITAVEGSISTIQFVELPVLSASIVTAAGVAADALVKANKSLGIWDESGNNVYHKKSGNVGIGITFADTLNNKLEVNGNINIPLSSNYKIGNQPLNYSHLAGTLSYNSLTDKLTQGTNITITGNVINNTYSLPTAGVGTGGTLGGVKVDGTTITITNQVISAVAGAQQVNSDWTQTNTSLKSFIQNKPTLFDGNYNSLTNKLTAGTNISIVANAINNTYTLPIAANGIVGGVKPDIDTIVVGATGLISLSGNDIFLNGADNRAYGWASSTSALGRVAVANAYSTGSAINDVVLRSSGNLILQSGITNPALLINTTNQALFRNQVGIGTTAISSGNMLDVGGILKVATGSGADRLTITSTGVQVNNTLNVSSGTNAGGLIRFGGTADDATLDLAIIQNREYATNKSEILLFKGNDIEGTTGADRIRLRAGAIAFDTYSAASTSSNTTDIKMYITGGGNIGIGTTTPSSKLHIPTLESTTTTTNLFDFRNSNNYGIYATSINVDTRGNSLDFVARDYNFGQGIQTRNVLNIYPSGRVGIGTIPWLHVLHLHRIGAVSQDVKIHFTDDITGTSASRGVMIGKGSDNAAIFLNQESADMRFVTSGGTAITIKPNGAVGIQRDGFAIPNNYMGYGSLTIGNIGVNYGGGTASWNTSTAGLLMECLDNTEMAVHDSGNSIHSFMSYTTNGNFTIGRNMGHGVANVTIAGALTGNSYILSTAGAVYARSSYDTLLFADSTGMYLCMGSIGSGTNATYFRAGAYSGHTFIQSNQSRNMYFDIYTGTFTGTLKRWEFNINGGAYNALNTTTWTQNSDHRIKENIVKADLKKCYDNVKNINLYRFNYIDTFNTSKQDKNKLGYIAQEVKKHFPKATSRKKERLTDNREIPDLLSIDVEQINLSLYGAVKQLTMILKQFML